MPLPLYTRDLERVLAEDFGPGLPRVPDVAPPSGPLSERVRTFEGQSGAPPPPLLSPPDRPPKGNAGPRRSEWEKYWTLLQGQSWTLPGVPFRLGQAQLPYPLRRHLDNVSSEVYWKRDQGFPTPRSFLAMLAKASQETAGDASFLESVEDWLRRIGAIEEVGPLLELRDELRVVVLVAGAEGTLSPGQAHGGSLALDILAYQALARLDARRAEAERGLKPRYEQLRRQERRGGALLCEMHLPRLARPEFEDSAHPREAFLVTEFLRAHPPPEQLLSADPEPASASPATPGRRPSPDGGHGDSPLPHFADLRTALAGEVPGLAEPILDRMALILHLHVRGFPRQRVLLTGAAGTGKTHLARACGRVLERACEHVVEGVAAHMISIPDLVETGWRGGNLAEALGEFLSRCDGSAEAFERGILIIDELDKAAPLADAGGPAYESKRGKQQSLLPLLGGEPVLLTSRNARYPDTTCETARILVLCTAAFSDAPWGNVRAPTTRDLVGIRFMREFAERITTALYLSFRRSHQLVEVFLARPEIPALTRAYRECGGYQLLVSPAALHYVARLVTSSPDSLGPRSGMALLTDAVQRRLIAALKAELPPGERVVIAPDDIEPPPNDERPGSGEEETLVGPV
jgi:hypothetical protein